MKAKRAALSEDQKAEARRLFASGSTRRELMAMYDVSKSTIKRMLAQPRRP
ncbi:helix-turn-helix domain-containing protein [Ammonicoccus fulvus]|uniref:helix-turn-helix domain-containing protein n=1 Tax=Ammonicoccus fulvus TaxID=3138240 RepID=UPI003CC7EAC2